MKCRHCTAELTLPLIDLGMAPPSNAYLSAAALAKPEKRYPLRVMVCEQCWLVQTEDFADAAELFAADYAYFSSFSSSWLEHAKLYAEQMTSRWRLGPQSRVVEVASNDGYLLQYFREAGIPCLGIEPTASTAAAAREKGIRVVERFFGRTLAAELVASGQSADLTAANNVLAHVPDINDFVAGFATLLKPDGVATFEFPHLLRLLDGCQFDTIYHEHFSYLSLCAVERVFAAAGLQVFDVEELPTHGGSLRVFAQRSGVGRQPPTAAVERVRQNERLSGLQSQGAYAGLQARAQRIRDDLKRFLGEARAAGRSVAAYGAAAKGNTLLNFAGVGVDEVGYVVDRNPAKQGKYMPGSRIPIVPPGHLDAQRPDYLLILPWNLAEEVRQQLAPLAASGVKFVTAVPELVVT